MMSNEVLQGNSLYQLCLELQKTEESFRRGLAVIKEVESEGNKFGNYTSLAQPFNALGQAMPVPFQTLHIKESFLSGDQNTVISKICDELDGLLAREMPSFISAVVHMRELEALYQPTVTHVNKERLQKGEKTIFLSISPTALPMQRTPRYVLLLKELVKQAQAPANNIRPDVVEKLKITLQNAENVAALVNQAKRDADIQQTKKMFSDDIKIQEILVKNGVGKETLLEPKDEKRAKKEIANAIRNGEPEDIKKALNKYQFSIGVDFARPGEDNPALVKTTAIKRDFYCDLIDSRIREEIRGTKASIHAKPNFTIWIRAIFHGYTDTTEYIIYEVNAAYDKYSRDKNNPASLKILNNYLPMLGVDQSATTLVMPAQVPAVAERGPGFDLLYSLGVVERQAPQPEPDLSKKPPDKKLPPFLLSSNGSEPEKITLRQF